MPFDYAPPLGYRGGFDPNFLHVDYGNSGGNDAPLYAGGNVGQSGGSTSWDNGYYAPYVGQPAAPMDPQRMMALQQMRGGGGGAQQPYDSVYTGHATERLPEDAQTLSMVPRLMQMFGPGEHQPSWGHYGVPGQGNFLRINGQEQQIPAGANDDWINQQVNAAKPAPMDPMQRSAALMKYLYAQPNMDALKASQLHTRVMGQDPASLQKSNSDYMQTALTLREKEQALRKSQMDQYEGFGKSQFGVSTGQALNTAGFHYINPTTGQPLADGAPGGQSIYSVLHPEEDIYDQMTGSVTGKRPSYYSQAQPGDIRYLQSQRQQLGFNDAPLTREGQQQALDRVNYQIALEEAQRSSRSASPAFGEHRLLEEAQMREQAPALNAIESARRIRQARLAPFYNRLGDSGMDYAAGSMW